MSSSFESNIRFNHGPRSPHSTYAVAVHGVYGGRVDAEAIDDDGGLRGSESTNECAREPNDGRAMSRHRAPRVVVRRAAWWVRGR